MKEENERYHQDIQNIKEENGKREEKHQQELQKLKEENEQNKQDIQKLKEKLKENKEKNEKEIKLKTQEEIKNMKDVMKKEILKELLPTLMKESKKEDFFLGRKKNSEKGECFENKNN